MFQVAHHPTFGTLLADGAKHVNDKELSCKCRETGARSYEDERKAGLSRRESGATVAAVLICANHFGTFREIIKEECERMMLGK